MLKLTLALLFLLGISFAALAQSSTISPRNCMDYTDIKQFDRCMEEEHKAFLDRIYGGRKPSDGHGAPSRSADLLPYISFRRSCPSYYYVPRYSPSRYYYGPYGPIYVPRYSPYIYIPRYRPLYPRW